MKQLTPEQIARYAYDAGFRGDGLTTAVAVAIAESGGRPGEHNTEGLDNSYGLWQINMYGSLGPDRRARYDLENDRELFDPEVNARVANLISHDGRNWMPWAAYTNGMYRQHLDEARRAARAVTRDRGNGGGGNGGGSTGGSGNGGTGAGGGNNGGGPGGGNGGFAVDTGVLAGYVKRTRTIADDLDAVGSTQLRRIRQIADDSFGKIGKESGFAAALDSFAAALNRQVRGVSSNADTLARTTGRTLRAYRQHDDDIAGDLGRIRPDR